MIKKHLTPLLCLFTLLLAACTADGSSNAVAVVDTTRILTSSRPALAGEAHMKQVQIVLQKGLDELRQYHQGKEHEAASRKALQEGEIALQRQMALEKEAVLKVLESALVDIVRTFREKEKYAIVISSHNLIHNSKNVDITDKIMQELNKVEVSFPQLPTVSVQR